MELGEEKEYNSHQLRVEETLDESDSSAFQLIGQEVQNLWKLATKTIAVKMITYRLGNLALVVEILAEAAYHLELLVNGEAVDGSFDNVADACLVHGNEAVEVHVREESHDELAIHAIGDTAVAGDRLAKVLHVEGTLQARGKESTERSDERGKRGESKDVELHRLNPKCLIKTEQLQRVGLRDKGGVWNALQTGQDVGSKVIDGADEVLVPHQHVRDEVSEDNGADPRAKESFNRLLGRQLNQLRTAKCNAADIGEDIISNDQRCRQEEPDHALENVVHHEVSLDHDQVQGHVGPGKLSELKSVVSLLQRADEEDEA